MTFILWIILSIIIGAAGSNKEIGGLGAFFISLLFSPIIGLIVVMTSSESKQSKVARIKEEEEIRLNIQNNLRRPIVEVPIKKIRTKAEKRSELKWSIGLISLIVIIGALLTLNDDTSNTSKPIHTKASIATSYKDEPVKINNINIDNIAGKTPKQVAQLYGNAEYKEIIYPSSVSKECNKFTYKNDLLEVVYINGKADWITVNSRYTTFKRSKYLSVDKFDYYTYAKVSTN